MPSPPVRQGTAHATSTQQTRAFCAEVVQAALLAVSGRYGTHMRTIGSLVCLLFATWLASWHLALGTAWFVATAVLLRSPRSTITWMGWTTLGALLVPWCVWGYTVRHEALAAAVLSRGPTALSVPDLFAVWGLNLLMAAAGAVLGFPEVAAETALLAVPRSEAITVHTSRFPACVPEVAEQVRRARHSGAGTGPHTLTWRYTADVNARGALALNPVEVEVVRRDDGLLLHATVPVDYPPSYRLVFADLGVAQLAVEEGLFHALEERGWLHPYRLTYTTHLADGAPLPSTCEAWSVDAARALVAGGGRVAGWSAPTAPASAP